MKIHQMRHNRSMPFRISTGRTNVEFEAQFKLLIATTTIQLTIRKKKFKLWI